MPIYEYICGKCSHQFEVLLRGQERPVCPSCGGGRLTKQVSVPGAPVIGSSLPACPARESGACASADQCRGGCGMSQWG